MNKDPRFSVKCAVAWHLSEDEAEIEGNRRYKPTRTPCAVYTNGDEYLTATKTNRTPRGCDDNIFGYWHWVKVDSNVPFGWCIWKHEDEVENEVE